MKKLILSVLILTLSETFAQSPLVQQIINSVNQDSLIFFVRELSGDVPTIINDTSKTILSRNKNQPGNTLAETYIQQKLQSYGLTTTIQSFSATGKNVYAVQPGTEFPNKKYIICAHFDDMPIGLTAPGADDNASGTAAVIEAGRIFSHYSFPYTIAYALWDEEEQGLIGSYYYANQAATNGDSILGVINLDMIAWDADSNNVAEIHTNNSVSSLYLANKLNDVNTDYNIGVTLHDINPGINASDHSSFWSNGYGAVLLIENYYGSDFNSYYHTVNDLLPHYNQPYFIKLVKLALGTLALLAEADLTSVENISESITDYRLEQNYPNPFNSSTIFSWQQPTSGFVSLKIYDVLGNEVITLLNKDVDAGNHKVNFNANNLPSGMYVYKIKNGNFVENRKMILLK